MIRELAEIVAVYDDSLQVSTELKTGCGSCAQQSTCGAGIISKAFSDRRAEFLVRKPEGQFQVGQMIELLLPEQALTQLSLMLYGLPLLALMITAVGLGELAGVSEGWVIISAFASFGLSFYGLKRWLHHRDVQVSQLLSVQQID
ncbi:SoxR reducing system RseC family protein [Pseudidiomarina donghaiensis]|uniref:SoxR reducing system RseC family protein n=1 Tax=Pseudidiomarina donghaiensis TaxID=519452 RepID=UPI003A985952